MATFDKGDHVVCPPHGAGQIVETKDRDGRRFLTIEVEHSGLRLIVPQETAEERGIRPVMKVSEANRVLRVLKADSEEMPDAYPKRAKIVEAKGATGEAEDLAELLRDLAARTADGSSLSTIEARTFDEARTHLAAELVYSKKISTEKALEVIDQAVEAHKQGA